MIPTHTKKPTPVVAFIFKGSVDHLDENIVASKITMYKNTDNTNTVCEKCNHHYDDHGSLDTAYGKVAVCPGNYVVCNPEFPTDWYPVTSDIFEKTYDDLYKQGAVSNECCSVGGLQHDDRYIRLDAARILVQYSSSKKAITYLESLLSEPEVK